LSTDAHARQSPDGDLSRSGNHRRPAIPDTPARTRPARVPTTLLEVSKRLRPRDLVIADLLDEHQTLTTNQISAVLFDNLTTCQHRLQDLRRLRFLDRFIRNRPRTPAPMCWVPGLLSARYTALARADNPPTARMVQDRQERVMSNPALAHLLGVNDFFIRLLVHARHHDGARLARWWSERTAAAALGRRVHPDGLGVWVDGNATTGFMVEFDTGSEPLGRLVDKLSAYRRLRVDGGPQYVLLFVLPTRARETNLHRRLGEGLDPGVVVATTSPEHGSDPAGPVWRKLGNGRNRYTLAALPGPLGETGPLNPGPPDPGDDPLRHLDAPG
jgi:Replication-relaxation